MKAQIFDKTNLVFIVIIIFFKVWPYQINRQYPIDNYIVDFISRKLKLIIEVDGSSHLVKESEDYERQKFLENEGFTVLRFSESRVIYPIDEVISEIDYAIQCIEQQTEDKKNVWNLWIPLYSPFENQNLNFKSIIPFKGGRAPIKRLLILYRDNRLEYKVPTGRYVIAQGEALCFKRR